LTLRRTPALTRSRKEKALIAQLWLRALLVTSKLLPRRPWNRHAQDRVLYQERVLQAVRAKRFEWNPQETLALRQVLSAQLQEDAFRRLFVERSATLSATEKQDLLLEIMGPLRRSELEELMEEHGHALDWITVANKLKAQLGPLQLRPALSAACCRIRYLHEIEGGGRVPLTKEQEARIDKVVEELGPFDWDGI
ncbi:unnamed protein product, partial [Polarella glacialis]